MKKLFISLDGGKKLSLGEIDTFSGRSFRLRTVDKNQYQARINLGLSDGYQSDPLHSAYLENLKSSANGFSYLDCTLKRDGNRLNLTIKNQSLTVCSDSFSLIPLKKRILFVLIPLFALLFLAGMISILLLSDFSLSAGTKRTSSTSPVSVPAQQMTQKTEPTAEVNQPPPEKKENPSDTVQRDIADFSEAETEGQASIPADSADKSSPEEPVLTDNRDVMNTRESGGPDIPVENVIISEKPDFSRLSEKNRIIHFTPNSAVIGAEEEKSLNNVLRFLLEYPRLNVRITGHCAIAGTEAGRREISEQRAKNVVSWLTSRGWSPEVPPEIIGAAGDYPLTLDPDNQQLNRRVEIFLSD